MTLNCGLTDMHTKEFSDVKLTFCCRVIKEKRDAYVKRLNEIYQKNLDKVCKHSCFASQPQVCKAPSLRCKPHGFQDMESGFSVDSSCSEMAFLGTCL